MSECITCPACSAQLPYTPDLVGLPTRCDQCRYKFTVVAPSRRHPQIDEPQPPEDPDYIPFAPEPAEEFEIDSDWNLQTSGYAATAVLTAPRAARAAPLPGGIRAISRAQIARPRAFELVPSPDQADHTVVVDFDSPMRYAAPKGGSICVPMIKLAFLTVGSVAAIIVIGLFAYVAI